MKSYGKMETRVYLRVPFERKEEVKKLGGRWDQGAKLWWIQEGVETPFQQVEHDYMTRRRECDGACFTEGAYGQTIRGCGACDFPKKTDRSCLKSQRFMDDHRDSCTKYDTELSARSGAREEELLSRENGERRTCLRCGTALQPIGFDRSNGRRVPDVYERMFHVSCFREFLREDAAFTELLVREERRRCRVCRCSIKHGPRVFINEREIYHLKCYETLKADEVTMQNSTELQHK
jgi:hypothetical protein